MKPGVKKQVDSLDNPTEKFQVQKHRKWAAAINSYETRNMTVLLTKSNIEEE